MDLFFTRTGDLGSLPEKVREACGSEGIRRIESLLEVPKGTFDTRSSIIRYEDNYRFFSLAADMLNERSVSLHMEKTDDARNLGLYGAYILGAPDLAAGLMRTVTVPRLKREFSYQFVEAYGNFVRFGYRCTYMGCADWRHQADLMVSYMVAFLEFYAGGDGDLRRIEVSYPRGLYEQELEDWYAVPVIFGKDAEAIVFERRALSCQPSGPDRSRRVVTKRDVEREKLQLPQSTPDRLRHLISQRLMAGKTDLEGLSSRIGLGPRSLQRRLAEFGTSYRELLEKERMARAIALLDDDSRSVDDISMALGYSSRTQFIRAFRTWTGTTPRRYATRVSGQKS